MVDKNIIQSRFTKLGVVPIDNQHYLYATLDNNLIGIIVYGLSVYLPVREAVATAFLHIVQNVGHAIVYVLGRVAVVLGKERIFRCTLLQIHLYRSLEMVCRFHIAVGKIKG